MKEKEWRANICIIKFPQKELPRTNNQYLVETHFLGQQRGCVYAMMSSSHVRGGGRLWETTPRFWEEFLNPEVKKGVSSFL